MTEQKHETRNDSSCTADSYWAAVMFERLTTAKRESARDFIRRCFQHEAERRAAAVGSDRAGTPAGNLIRLARISPVGRESWEPITSEPRALPEHLRLTTAPDRLPACTLERFLGTLSILGMRGELFEDDQQRI